MSEYLFLNYKIYHKYLESLFDFGITPTVVGYEKCSKNKERVGPMTPTKYVLHYVISGKGTISINNTNFSVNKGAIFLISPSNKVSYLPDADDPWQYIWIEMIGKECNSIIALTGLNGKNPVIYPKQSEIIYQAFADIVENSLTNEEYNSINIASKTLSILHALIEDNNVKRRQIHDKNNMDVVIEYMSQNYYDCTLSVEEIAKRFSFSLSYLSKLFKKSVGISPLKYLINIRMKEACKLLDTGLYSIIEIAYSVGYNSPFYFSNEFKRKFGIAPKDYREHKNIE